MLEHPDWLSGSGALSDFKARHDGGFVGQSEALRHAWRQLMDDISAHQATLEPTYDSLSALSAQLQQWFTALTADSSPEASLQDLTDAALQQGEALAARLQQAEDHFAPTVHATVAQLPAQNAALSDSAAYEWSEKRYNEIALQWLLGIEPDSTALADLRPIAQTCLSDGGRAVLDAHGLCAVWLKEYYDEDGCLPAQPHSSEGNASESATANLDLRIAPSPARDVVWISLHGATDEAHQVQVFGADGRQVFSGTLSRMGRLALPVRDWPSGLYVVRLSGNGAVMARKFLVQQP